MGFFNKLFARATMMASRIAEEVFDLDLSEQDETTRVVDYCLSAYHGTPEWLYNNSEWRTVNFAKTICEEIAKLATMNIEIFVDGSPRADYLNSQIHRSERSFRRWVELGVASGTMLLKPNGKTIDVYLPSQFKVVKTDGDAITEVVFFNYAKEDDRYYTRLELHKREEKYTILNKCFVSYSKNDIGREVPIEDTPWKDLAEEVVAENVTGNLFGTFFTPSVNNEDLESPLGLPVVANSLVELEGLDGAFSLCKKEIDVSKRTVLMDSDRLIVGGQGKIDVSDRQVVQNLLEKYELPDYIKLVEGSGTVDSDIYHEINPSLSTETRLVGINAYLSQIGFKCGFSNGYFVFNEKTGMITATQVESDDRRTIQLINDVRTQLKSCIDELIYALNAFADAYGLAPRGEYEVAYDFADITLNHDEDRARWYGYVVQNKIPFWYYLTKFEGYSEDEAKELEELAKIDVPLYPSVE